MTPQTKARFQVLGAAFLATIFIVPFKYVAQGDRGAGAALGLLLSVSILLLPFGIKSMSKATKERKIKTLSLGWKLAICAAFGNIAQGYAFAVLHPGLASIFIQMSVLFVAIIGVIWLKEKLTIYLSLSVLICISGILYSQHETFLNKLEINWGVAWALGAALGFSLMDLLSRKHSGSVDLLGSNLVRSILATLILSFVPGAINQLMNFSLLDWVAIVLAALIGPGIARQLLLSASRDLKAVESSLIQQLRPVLALPLGSIAFGLWPSTNEWLGATLIIIGIIAPTLLSYFQTKKHLQSLQDKN